MEKARENQKGEKTRSQSSIQEKLSQLAEEGDLNSIMTFVANSPSSTRARYITVCLRELAERGNEITYRLLIKRTFGEFRANLEAKYDVLAAIKLLKAFYETVSVDVIYIDRSSFLNIIKEEALKLVKPGKKLPSINWELHKAIACKMKHCFSAAVKCFIESKDWGAISLILRSNFREKISLCERIIAEIQTEYDIMSNVIRKCLENKVTLKALVKIIRFDLLDTESRRKLFCSALSENRPEVIHFGIKENLFKLQGDLLVLTFSSECFEELLNSYFDIYRNYIHQLLTGRFGCCSDSRALHYLVDPRTLQILFKHKEFDNNRIYKDEMFRFLFVSCENLLSPFTCMENRYTAVSAFCILLDYSKNIGGLSQDVINTAFSTIVFANGTKFEESLVNFQIYVTTTMTSHGYTFTELELSQEFLDGLKGSKKLSNLLDLLIEISDQTHFNIFNRKIKGNNTIMTLKGMARRTIRRHVKIPFRRNLKRLIRQYCLPFIIEQLLNLHNEFAELDAHPIKFEIDDQEGVTFVDEDEAIASPDFILIENFSFFRDINCYCVNNNNNIIVEEFPPYPIEPEVVAPAVQEIEQEDLTKFCEAFV
ncbi:DgyrCDS5891 [Dimorphilus gyrociliatus]|uniref:DgyrCDS5891 n=1 Tax=Dimorphilus gyrociliatus TaxID=2664684 RepID=A0A7I8VLD2_9ANNE|nr:DgyrCDS5891 [Dimorphilus gyrociliatus]